jgi:4-hydroxy-tetrahydrodipicolinate synthase
MNPAGIHALYENWNSAEGEALQARADTLRRIFQAPTMIPAMKRALSEFARDPDWRYVRPPLMAMDDGAAATLLESLRIARFEMPGYPTRR